MAKLQILSIFLTERLTLAAQEIFKAVEDIFSEYNEELCRSRQEIELLKRRLQQTGLHMDSESQPCRENIHTQAFSEEWRSEHDLKDTEMHMKLEVYTPQEENEVHMPVSAPLSDICHDQMPSNHTEAQMMDSSENTFPFIIQVHQIKIESDTETGTACEARQHITTHGLDGSGANDVSKIIDGHIGSRHKTQTFNQLPLRNQEMLTQHRMELAEIRERMSLTIQLRNSDRKRKKNHPYVCQDKVSKLEMLKARNARHSQAWRDRLKKDPVRFAQYKALEAARAKEYRRRRNAAAGKIDKENNREQQRRFRAQMKLKCRRTEEQCKADEEPSPCMKRKVLTRTERMKKQEYDRIKKTQERERMAEEKRRKDKEMLPERRKKV